MLNRYIKLFVSFCVLISLCSCNTVSNSNKDFEIYTYNYDFQFYGFDNDDISLKASTVSALKSVLDNSKTAIFTISSPTCLSCKNALTFINDVAIKHNLTIYNIDPYSSDYPVFDTEDYDVLLSLLDVIGINGDVDFELPIVLIINKGNIDVHLIGFDHTNGLTYDQNLDIFDKLLSSSTLYK